MNVKVNGTYVFSEPFANDYRCILVWMAEWEQSTCRKNIKVLIRHFQNVTIYTTLTPPKKKWTEVINVKTNKMRKSRPTESGKELNDPGILGKSFL